MTPRTWTTAELEQEFERRERRREQMIVQVVEALKPQLERMAQEISDANHVKTELAQELRANTSATEDLQRRLEAHSELSFHQIGARIIDETGLLTVSQAERRALPEVLQEHVRARRDGVLNDRRLRWKIDLWNAGTHAAAAFFGGVGAAIAVYLALRG